MRMDIRTLDLANGAALEHAYAVECEATRHARPGWVPLGEAARIMAWRADDGWRRLLVAACEGDRMVGFASSMTADDTPGTSWLTISVLPQHQRRGVGTALARAAEAISPAGERRFLASAYRPTAEDIQGLTDGFARPLGYACATTETVLELDLLGGELPPTEPADGYRVSTYVNGVPEHLRGQVGVLKGMVDVEAPNGELNWEPTPVSAEEYTAELALWQKQGRTAVESIAVDRLGTVVAWTCLVAAADPRRPAQVEGTLVLAPHRGHRLGTAVKVACLVAARERRCTTRVRTSSDDQNQWMRRINDELGFGPVESEIVLHKQRPPAAA